MLYRGKPPMGWNSWDCYGDSVNEGPVLLSIILRRRFGLCPDTYGQLYLLYAGILGYFFPQYGQTAPSGPVITLKVFRHLLSVHFFFI